ncbi:GNAT family N-acetyltransferase [Corynebacterium aquatimens]|uniref:GNAT family acetyltransferase n=1 Tax=Corynebacterium aquatimens TaxID=1190508 RepID=A0A931GW88_9CORY|nr:GNAT family N-acetyltransferase [Corynebacterium aquatimens]MBG6122266.1 putative GNAT family acetyltransferase [Corynebacterium aquatimens]WJY65193.1 hypothetical protein CAQUA_02330 [Corynebacterium aquatimens]
MSDNIEITNQEAHHRYVITIGGEDAGFANYVDVDDSRREFNHTVVYPEFRGQGVSGKLIEHALNDAREMHKKVIPSCSAVDGFITKHPEYEDLRA